MSEVALKKHRILEDLIKMRRFFRVILDFQRQAFDSDSTNI